MLLSDHFVLSVSLLYFFVLWLFIPGIAEVRNLANLSSNMWPLLTVVIGQMFVLIVGGIDLSQTSIMAVTSVLGAMVMSSKLDPALFEKNPLWGVILRENGGLLGGSFLALPVGILVMLVVGALIGLLNGLSVAKLKMPPFTVTLVSMFFFSGLAICLTRSENIMYLPKGFITLGKGATGSFCVALVLATLAWLVLSHMVLGLIGENGAGKSTLMNILGGVIKPGHGQMWIRGAPYQPANPSEATRAGIAFIHQELNLFVNLSVLDNMFIDGFPTLGGTPLINRRRAKEMTQRFLEAVALDIPASAIVEHLAPGKRQLVEIARALSQDAQIIIFDEPTISLTAKESRRLFKIIDRLRREGRTMLYISHNLGDVLRLSDSIVVLRDGRVVDTGPTSEYTAERMITKMVGRDISQLYPSRDSQATSDAVLEVTGLTQAGIVKDITFSLHKGEVLGAFGLMGSGRSELARILFGIDPYQNGTIAVRGQIRKAVSPRRSIDDRIASVTENRREEGLLMEASVQDNTALVLLRQRTWAGQIIDRSRVAACVGQVVESLKIKGTCVRTQPVRNLSGGNQQKVVIGKWLLTEPEVLILDEPTRGIDVGARYEIYCIIRDLAAAGRPSSASPRSWRS